MNLSDVRGRLSKLERKEDLEKLLATVDEGLPWHDFVWMLQFPAYIGAAIQVTMMGMNAKEGDDGPPGEEMAWLLLLVLIGVAMKFLHPLFRNKLQKLRRRVRKKGFVLPAALVQANSLWGQVENWVHGSVLICFDPNIVNKPELLTEAAKSVFALKGVDRSTLPKDQRALAWSLYHELAPVRSIKVPESLTGGLKNCIMATVQLPPEALCEGSLLFALAVPDNLDPNAIAMLPEEVMTA